MKKYSTLSKFAKIGVIALCIGTACLGIVGLAFVVAAVYEQIKSPTDMHLPGLVSAMLLLYLAPIGGLLIILAGLLLLLGARK